MCCWWSLECTIRVALVRSEITFGNGKAKLLNHVDTWCRCMSYRRMCVVWVSKIVSRRRSAEVRMPSVQGGLGAHS